jgi:dihydropteroate synthase
MWPIDRSYRSPTIEAGRGRTWRWGTRTLVMGILNATGDSFSGDGVLGRLDEARRLARSLALAEVDIIDIGGASSRPGADPVPAEVESGRVVPVIAAVRELVDVPISVDTSSAAVAEAALDAGADMVNDITGLRLDPELAPLVAERGVPVVLMHNQRGRPHRDVVQDIRAGWERSLEICAAAGIPDGSVILDPGFGFGWSVEQNLEILRRLPELWGLELPLLLGTSRKSTIGAVLGVDVGRRRFGTAATVAQAICAGADVVRVHDAAEMTDVARVTDAIVR